MDFTIEDVCTYMKASYLCSITNCEECRTTLYNDTEHDCPLDHIDKDKIRKYLSDIADKILVASEKDYSIDEDTLINMIMNG